MMTKKRADQTWASINKSAAAKGVPVGVSEPAAPAQCVHEHLNEEGYCRKCGTDFRSGVEMPPAQASGAMSEERLRQLEKRSMTHQKSWGANCLREACTEIRRLRSEEHTSELQSLR